MNPAIAYTRPTATDGKKAPVTAFAVNDTSYHFEIQTIEWLQSQYVVPEPVKTSHFELLLIQKGKGNLQLDGQEYLLAENNVYCVFPGYFRKLNFAPDTEGYYISFAIEFLKLSEGYSNSSSWL